MAFLCYAAYSIHIQHVFFCFSFSICHDLNVTFDRLSIKQMIWWIIRPLLLNVAAVRLMFGHFSKSLWSFRSSFTFISHPSLLLSISTSARFPYAVVQTFCINSYLAKTNIALPIGPFSFLSLRLPVLHLFLAQLHSYALSHLTSTHSHTGRTRLSEAAAAVPVYPQTLCIFI